MKVRHIVLLKLKDRSKADDLFRALGELQKLIPAMLDYSYGVNSSPEGLAQGYEHAFVMVFADAAARNLYLDHPEHEKVKQQFLPYVESIVVFDYES
jgi:hypothetical protein